LARLASDKQALAVQPARSLVLLSRHLGDHSGRSVVDRILKPAWKIHPGDFSLCYELGWWNDVRFSTAAVALRPQSAAARYQLAQRLMPSDGLELGISTSGPVKPLADLEEAITHYRAAIRLKPDLCHFHLRLAHALFLSGSYHDEAVAEYREAIRLDRWWFSQSNLAVDLFRVGKWEQALAELRDSIRRYPDYAMLKYRFIDMLEIRGESAKVIRELRELIRLSPENSYPRGLLANALFHRGEIRASIAVSREAIRLDPTQAELRNTLGYRLLDLGEIDDSLVEIREALTAKPNDPNLMYSRGWALVARGEIQEGLTCLSEASRVLKDKPHPELQAHLRLVQRLTALEGRLDAILRGRDALADTEGKLDFAELCRLTRRFAASAKFYRETFLAKPTLVDDLTSQHRLHAAIAAAQAGTMPTPPKDDILLDDAERARWRAQGLNWLRDEKDACAKIITTTVPAAAGASPAVTIDPANLALARKTLDIVTHHRDLACVRDEKELANLPELERKEWQAFWSEVAALLTKAEKS
jgi:tetratricopeptide (TPR) repeat protein